MGKKPRRPSDPLLVSVRSGAKFSMPGMMDTVLNLGLNDESVEGLAKQTSDERFAYDSYRRFVSMYGRIVLGIAGEAVRHPVRAGQGAGGRGHRRRGPGGGAARTCSTTTSRSWRGHTGAALPAGARRPAAGSHRSGVRLLERGPGRRLPGTASDPARPGHRRQRPGHGVRQPRRQLRDRCRLHPRPGHRGQGRVRRLSRQRPGRGRGRRHPQHRAAVRPEGAVPGDLRGADGHLRPAGAPLPGHVRHRVHHRAGQALDAADPGRQAHRAGRPADGGRDDQGRARISSPARRRSAGSPPSTSIRSCTRSSPAAATRCSPPAWPRPRARRWAVSTRRATTPRRQPSAASG